MPKSKPDQVVVHRIELQQHERETIDAFLIGKTATNALSAIGAIIGGLGPAIGAIVAAYIAKEGIDKFNETWQNFYRRAGDKVVEPYRKETDYYRAVTAFLMAQSSASDAEANWPDLWTQLEGSKLVLPKVKRFVYATRNDWKDWQWGIEAAQKWKGFYSPSELVKDMKEGVKKDLNPSGNRGITWLIDRIT